MAKMINIYMNGTDERYKSIDRMGHRAITSLANVLHALTVVGEDDLSIPVQGCGIDNPYARDLGAIFAWNLVKQVDDLEKRIRDKVDPRNPIVLNLYGFSRGAAGIYLLCSRLKDIPADQIQINLLAFEPVPGNSIWGAHVDKSLGIKQTLASQISELSDCQNINKSYALYTNQPLLDIICHGPILPIMPGIVIIG